MNFQTFKLDLEKAEEPEIKFPTSRWIIERAREFQKSIYFCFIDYTKSFDCVDHNKLWKTLKEMGIPYLSPEKSVCRSRTTVKTGHGGTNQFQIGKGVRQGCILSPCLFNLYAEYTMRDAGLDESQAGIKIARRNVITSDKQMIPPLWQKVKN